MLMGRFATTVAFYESARPPYGAAFFTNVAKRVGLNRTERLLDVGAGPGVLAIGFAPFVREAVGVDPEPNMVEAARAAAARAGAALTLVEGRFEDLAESLGAFDAITIGRASHWLDPEPAGRALERVVAPHGRVLLCNARSAQDGRNPWLASFEAIRRRWGGERPPRKPGALFEGTRFAARETIRVETAHTVPIERLADRVLSMSTSSPARLGDEVPAMREAMRDALAPFAVNGAVEDIVEARAEVYEAARP
jgi:SAM-dependent methyltransferase